MRLTFPILAVLLALPGFGQWNRYPFAGKEEEPEIADSHPLAYFTHEGLVRNDSGKVGCNYCTSTETAKIRAEAKAEVSEVGMLGDYTVYEIFYYFDPSNEVAGARSILVQTGSDQFREIFYLGNSL